MFKDTIIKGKAKKRELSIFGISFLFAYSLNVAGIIRHDTPVKELYTQIHVVFLLALVIYAGVILLRILYYLVSRMWNRK